MIRKIKEEIIERFKFICSKDCHGERGQFKLCNHCEDARLFDYILALINKEIKEQGKDD